MSIDKYAVELDNFHGNVEMKKIASKTSAKLKYLKNEEVPKGKKKGDIKCKI